MINIKQLLATLTIIIAGTLINLGAINLAHQTIDNLDTALGVSIGLVLWITLIATIILGKLLKALRSNRKSTYTEEPYFDPLYLTEKQFREARRQRQFVECDVEHNTNKIKRKFGPLGENLGND